MEHLLSIRTTYYVEHEGGFEVSVLIMQSREEKRLKKEISETQKKDNEGVWARLVGDDLRHWKGYIKGPEKTPFEGGLFIIDIAIGTDYPYNPPKMKFDTKIWHPNMSSQTGAICLDILKSEWSPALTIRTALLSIQALLTAAEPNDPQDSTVAEQYKSDRAAYDAKAREWTRQYATDSQEDTEAQLISQLTDMGFDVAKARDTLMRHNWSVENALNELLQ